MSHSGVSVIGYTRPHFKEVALVWLPEVAGYSRSRTHPNGSRLILIRTTDGGIVHKIIRLTVLTCWKEYKWVTSHLESQSDHWFSQSELQTKEVEEE